ncbi:MAG: hypothetical protein ACOYIA_06290 [Eubacteriales bacterium]|jgi:hypothetical protein
MTGREYDRDYTKRCRRRVKFEKIKYALFWIVPLTILLGIALAFVFQLFLRSEWQKFSWELAWDIVYARENDSARATYAGEDVRLSDHNCNSVYKMILDAGPTGTFWGGEGETIHIDFGNGHTMDIVNTKGERCAVVYRGEKDYKFKIGVQGMFGKLVIVTSFEGGSVPNSRWEEKNTSD